MEVVKQEQELMYTLPDIELTESGSLADTDTSSAVISPLFVITPADVDETGQPPAAVSCFDSISLLCNTYVITDAARISLVAVPERISFKLAVLVY